MRQNAIKALSAAIEGRKADTKSVDSMKLSSNMFAVVKMNTKEFKETNVNVLKAIFEFFSTINEYQASKEEEMASWMTQDATGLAVQKISDRKLTGLCKGVLSGVCVVAPPASVLRLVIAALKAIRSPVAHEETLKWFQSFCEDFGVASLGASLTDTVAWVTEVSCLVSTCL